MAFSFEGIYVRHLRLYEVISFLVIKSGSNHTLLVSLVKGVGWMRIPALSKKKPSEKRDRSSWWRVVKVYLAKGKYYRLPPRR